MSETVVWVASSAERDECGWAFFPIGVSRARDVAMALVCRDVGKAVTGLCWCQVAPETPSQRECWELSGDGERHGAVTGFVLEGGDLPLGEPVWMLVCSEPGAWGDVPYTLATCASMAALTAVVREETGWTGPIRWRRDVVLGFTVLERWVTQVAGQAYVTGPWRFEEEVPGPAMPLVPRPALTRAARVG